MNKTFQVITDSTSDLTQYFRNKYQIDYVQMTFSMDGQDYNANLDWKDISPQQYYSLLEKGKFFLTGPAPLSEFERVFTKYLSQNLDILFISCSSILSGTFNNALIAKSILQEKYPGRQIICFDSLRSNCSEGLMAMDAAMMANQGISLSETIKFLDEKRLKYQTLAITDSLDPLKRAGRIKTSSAFIGNLVGIKPIIITDAHGNNYAFKTARGRNSALKLLAKYVINNVEKDHPSLIFIEHSNCMDDAHCLAEEIQKKLPSKQICICDLGFIVGATIGSKALTVSFYGKKVTIYNKTNGNHIFSLGKNTITS